MPRGGTGTYTLPITFLDGQTISAPDMMTDLNDIGTALTYSLAADGQTPVTGNFDWGGKNITNIGTVAATAGAFTAAATTNGMTVGDALTVTKGGVTVSAGGATITGNSTVTGTLAITSTATASNATKGTEVVNYSQFPQTQATTGALGLPGGLLLKWGTGTYTAGAGSVTYGTPFPTATLNVQITLATSGATHTSIVPGVNTGSYATTGFSVDAGAAQNGSFTWLAIGY